MKSRQRYGVRNPDGSFTAPITDQFRLAQAYAGQVKGKVFDVEDDADPITIEYREAFPEAVA